MVPVGGSMPRRKRAKKSQSYVVEITVKEGRRTAKSANPTVFQPSLFEIDNEWMRLLAAS
jgi:hypothetical protein